MWFNAFSSIFQRERKQRKLYSEEWALGDEEAVEGGRGFSLADKLESPRFEHAGIIKEMAGTDLTVAYLQRFGFNSPLLFKDKNGLGIRLDFILSLFIMKIFVTYLIIMSLSVFFFIECLLPILRSMMLECVWVLDVF